MQRYRTCRNPGFKAGSKRAQRGLNASSTRAQRGFNAGARRDGEYVDRVFLVKLQPDDTATAKAHWGNTNIRSVLLSRNKTFFMWWSTSIKTETKINREQATNICLTLSCSWNPKLALINENLQADDLTEKLPHSFPFPLDTPGSTHG